MTTTAETATVVEATADIVAEGVAVSGGGRVAGDATGATLREGDIATVRLVRAGERWAVDAVFHPAAAPVDQVDRGLTLYAKGRLAVCSDAATQEATLRLVDARTVRLHRAGAEAGDG